MNADEISYWANFVGLASASLAGVYASVRSIFFAVGWFYARQKKEDAWTAQDKRIGEVTDRFTGVLNELQSTISQATQEQERKSRERDLAIHRRLDEHITSDQTQFGTVLRSLGKIEGRLGIPQEE